MRARENRVEGGQDRAEHDGGEEALSAAHIAEDGAEAGGLAVGLAGLVVDAGHGDGADVVSGLVSVLGGLGAERGQGAVDNAGVDLLDVLVAETELLHEAGLVGGEDNVGVLCRVKDYILCVGVGELDLKASLAAVLAAGVGGHTVCVEHEASAGLAAGSLALDNVRAVVGKVGADDGTGCVGGKVKNLDSFEHFHGSNPFL